MGVGLEHVRGVAKGCSGSVISGVYGTVRRCGRGTAVFTWDTSSVKEAVSVTSAAGAKAAGGAQGNGAIPGDKANDCSIAAGTC